ncbi:unnamed protein product [Closterium sp. Naga37s-1]|nr:unnamed protein product [Closterium sp. Naga37s-1]
MDRPPPKHSWSDSNPRHTYEEQLNNNLGAFKYAHVIDPLVVPVMHSPVCPHHPPALCYYCFSLACTSCLACSTGLAFPEFCTESWL